MKEIPEMCRALTINSILAESGLKLIDFEVSEHFICILLLFKILLY
jgi:hypothetical protein